jgi:hypothetical protein
MYVVKFLIWANASSHAWKESAQIYFLKFILNKMKDKRKKKEKCIRIWTIPFPTPKK